LLCFSLLLGLGGVGWGGVVTVRSRADNTRTPASGGDLLWQSLVLRGVRAWVGGALLLRWEVAFLVLGSGAASEKSQKLLLH
jgi:hypothetical protein